MDKDDVLVDDEDDMSRYRGSHLWDAHECLSPQGGWQARRAAVHALVAAAISLAQIADSLRVIARQSSGPRG